MMDPPMKIAVIIPAAGAGRRFAEGGAADAAPNKLELELVGKPVFLRSVELFIGRPGVAQVLLAVQPDAIDDFRLRWGDRLSFDGVELVAGGQQERWETVQRALERVRDDCTHVAVHDAARPLASDRLIERVFEAAARHDAVIPALPVANTIKRVSGEEVAAAPADPLDAILGGAGKPVIATRRVVETVDRRDLVEVQTPQVFRLELLRAAYAQVADGRVDPQAITDDAGLVEALGDAASPVVVVEGEATNFKITRPADGELAEALLERRAAARAARVAKKALFGDEDEN